MKQKRIKNLIIKLKLISSIILTFSLIMLLIKLSFGTSVIINDKPNTDNTYTIDCLGIDNRISLYGLDDNKKEYVIFSANCKNKINIYSQYIDKTYKIKIINNEDSDDRINYIEYLNKIDEKNINVKIDKFDDKICFTIKMPYYVNVKIGNDEEENVKNYYKCFEKSSFESFENELKEIIIPIYVNDRLIQEYKMDKPKEKLRISFQDLGIMNKKLDDKMIISITNPSNHETKVRVVDSNIPCHTKQFVLSDKYNLYCNKTSNDENYFIQLQTQDKKIYYADYTKPPERKKSRDNNLYLFIIGGVLILFIGYNIYKNKANSKDKSAIEQLEEENEKQRD